MAITAASALGALLIALLKGIFGNTKPIEVKTNEGKTETPGERVGGALRALNRGLWVRAQD